MNVIRKSYNIFSEGGEPLFNLSLPSFERNDITNQKQRGIVPEVRYANGGFIHQYGGDSENTQKMNRQPTREEAASTGNRFWDLSDYATQSKQETKEVMEQKEIPYDSKKSAWLQTRDYYSRPYDLPYVKEHEIKVTNGGKRLAGSITTTEVLDAIQEAANNSGISLQDALGIVAKESNLGYGYGMIKNHKSPNLMMMSSAWNSTGMGATPVSDVNRVQEITEKYRNNEYITQKDLDDYKRITSKELQYIKESHTPKENPMEYVFNNFRQGKNGNPGDPNNRQKIQDYGEAMYYDPAIEEYYRSKGVIYPKDTRGIDLTVSPIQHGYDQYLTSANIPNQETELVAQNNQARGGYLKGTEHDLSLAEIHELRKQGYKISYL